MRIKLALFISLIIAVAFIIRVYVDERSTPRSDISLIEKQQARILVLEHKNQDLEKEIQDIHNQYREEKKEYDEMLRREYKIGVGGNK
jgi:peptidoglycan hydrolase CwlO-like protein